MQCPISVIYWILDFIHRDEFRHDQHVVTPTKKNQELRAGDVHAPSKKEEGDEGGQGAPSDPSPAARSTANVGVAGGADVEREALVKREYAWCVVQVDRANFQLRNALWGRANSLVLLSRPLSPSLGYTHAHTHTHNTHIKM